jgi:hypothetical protein
VTPETRAARDRIAQFLDVRAACGGEHSDRVAERFTHDGPTDATITVTDLRLVLAALDQQPDAILISDAVLDQEQVEELRRRFLAAQHDRTPIRALDGPPDAAQLDYHAARPQQHPEGKTSDD